MKEDERESDHILAGDRVCCVYGKQLMCAKHDQHCVDVYLTIGVCDVFRFCISGLTAETLQAGDNTGGGTATSSVSLPQGHHSTGTRPQE